MSRREWALAALGLAGSADLASAWQHAHQAATATEKPKLQHVDPAWAAEIEAISAEIVPSDGSPGAHEAGVLYFIDSALGSWDADKRDAYAQGLADLRRRQAAMFPKAAGLASLSGAEMRQLLTSIETSAFFDLVRTHTVVGFFGSPHGRALLGIEEKMQFDPPFGYYDAEALKGGG